MIFGFQFVKHSGIFADVLLDGVAEAQIEPAVIHADDGVRLAFDCERQQLVEESAELQIVLQHVRERR